MFLSIVVQQEGRKSAAIRERESMIAIDHCTYSSDIILLLELGIDIKTLSELVLPQLKPRILFIAWIFNPTFYNM